MSMSKGKEIIDSGGKSAGVFCALELGSSKMPLIDHFEDLDPMLSNDVEQYSDSHLFEVWDVTAEESEGCVEARFKKVTTTKNVKKQNMKRQRIKFP